MGFFDKDVIREENSVFKNEIALSYDFLPREVPFRKPQQQIIANAIKPLFVGRNGRNLIITGKPGIGKTVATKHVLREIDDNYSDEITTLFINCWQYNSSFKVAENICHQLGFKLTQNKKTNELFTIAEKMLNKKAVVFVFDEIDKAEECDFLYELLENIYTKSFLLITNFSNWIDTLDDRIKSRLMPELVSFKPYNSEEVNGILKDRVNYAFLKSLFDDEAMNAIADKSYRSGDLRVGIYLLRECGLIAQERGVAIVNKEIAEYAISKVSAYKKNPKVDSLTEEDMLIFKLVSEHPGSTQGELYDFFAEAGGKGVYKTFQRKVKSLEKTGLIKATQSGGGSAGNVTILEPASENNDSLSNFL